jgi:hypothetical protein
LRAATSLPFQGRQLNLFVAPFSIRELISSIHDRVIIVIDQNYFWGSLFLMGNVAKAIFTSVQGDADSHLTGQVVRHTFQMAN